MAARQEDVNSAMLSILKKMDTMVAATQQTYEQSLITLGSVETIMKVDVGAELKKQTGILMSIEAKLGKQSKGEGGGGDSGNLKDFKEAFGSVAEALDKILKAAEKIDKKKSDNLKDFFTKLSESINEFSKNVDAGKAKAAADLIAAVGSGVLKYALVLTLATPLLIIALPGAMLFGLSIRLLMMSMGSVDKNQVEAMKAVLALAKGALLYSLAMVAVTLMSPIVLIGSVLFGLSIRLLMLSAGSVNKKDVKGMEAVLSLAKGALYYSLAMVVVTLLAPIVLIGSLILGLSLRVLAWGLKAIGSKNSRQGIKALLVLSIAIFAFSLVLWAFTKMVDVQTAMFTVLTIVGFALVFFFIGKQANVIYKGALAMIVVSFAVIVLALGLMLFKASKFDLMDALTLGITITGLGVAMVVAGKFMTDIIKGSIAMILASTAIIVLSIGLAIFKASKFEMMDALTLGAVIAIVGIAMGIAGAGPIPAFIIAGSIAMMLAGTAIIVLSIGLAIFKASKFGMFDALALGAAIGAVGLTMGLAGVAAPMIMMGAISMILAGVSLIPLSLGLGAFKLTGFKIEDSLSLGAAIGAVGIAMGIAGLAFPFILLGSVAMTVAAVALLPIAGALAIFKTIGWKDEDGKNLQGALGSVINGFLGGEMPGGLIASIKFAAQAAARAVLLFITVPPMILAGLALGVISMSLSKFKKIGFTKEDGDNVEYMIASVARAFSIITDKDRQKEMGVNFNPMDLMIGIVALSGAGNVLSSLAQGVQAWANLEVYDWQVINPGTSKAKLVIAGKRKLNKSDFENAAYGMAQVISAISAPFAKVGRLEKGGSSGDPYYDSIYAGGFVSAGISALARSGDTLVNLAKGIQAWANLEITEYEVVNGGTSKAKIVPKGVRKLTPVDFAMASLNIGMVIGFLANEFAMIGRAEMENGGVYAGGFVTRGIKSISGLGDQLLTIADVITKMANMEILENEIKDGKIVPKSVRKMTPVDFLMASVNIGMITGFLAREMAKIGEMESNSEGWFSDGYVKKGIEAISGLGQNVSSIADAVMKLANAEVTEYVVQNGKLVPKSTRKMNAGDFVKAGLNIDKILGILIYGMTKAGRMVEANKDAFSSAMDAIPNMTSTLADMAKPIDEWSKLKDVDKVGGSITSFISQIQSNFDPQKNKEVVSQDKYFTTFVKNIETMANSTNSMTKMAENFDKIQKSMKLTKDSINAMDLKKLTLTDSLMKSLAAIAKNPEAMARAVEGGINEAFQQLAKALEELGNKQSQGLQNVADNLPKNPAPGPDGKPVVPTGADAKTKAEMNKNKALGENNMQKDFIAALTAYGAAKQNR